MSFVGRKGFEKFIKELPKLKYELAKEEYDKILKNMVMFFGTVPTVPNALRGISEPDKVNFFGGFDKMSRVLEDMGREYDNKNWIEASEHFGGGAAIISEIKDVILAYLTGEDDKTDELPKLFTKVMEITLYISGILMLTI